MGTGFSSDQTVNDKRDIIMARKWIKTQYPGVRYYEHKERKHNNSKDRNFYIRYKKDGKTVDEASGWASHGMNAQKANSFRADIIQHIREGKYPQSLAERRRMEEELKEVENQKKLKSERENVTFDEIAKDFLDWASVNKKDHFNDKSRYGNHIKPVLGKIRVKDVSPLSIEKLKRDIYKKGLSDKTVHHCLALIRTIYRKAKDWGRYRGEIPTKLVKWPKLDNKRVRFLSQSETKVLLEEIKKVSFVVYDQAIISLHCGLRFSEIAKLRWSHVDLENDVLQIMDPKDESRHAYITKPVKIVLERLDEINSYETNDLIFKDKNGNPQQHVSNTYYRTVKKIGLNDGITDRRQKVCFHTLRHTFASWLAIQGTSLYEIKELMGHKSIAMTERYAHLIPSVKRNAVEKLADNFEAHMDEEKTAEVVDIHSN